MVLAKKRYGLREQNLLERRAQFVPFTAQTRMSGVDMDGSQIRKGAVDAVIGWSGRELPAASSAPRSSASPGPAGPHWPWPGTGSRSGSSS